MGNEQLARRERARFSEPALPDRLPPHSDEAERGVLGCVLFDPARAADCVKQALDYFQDARPFYDLKHGEIFAAMVSLHLENAGIDGITLMQRLKERNRLEECGGMDYLARLPDAVPSAVNLPHYLEIVWEKHIARELLRANVDAAARVFAEQELEPVLSAIKSRVVEIEGLAARHSGLMPPHLKTLADFEQKYWDMWFGSQAGEPGLELPFGFPWKVRRGEMTFLIADKGAGKSTLLSYIFLHLLCLKEKACIASMEVKPEVTLKVIAAQLLGTTHLPDNEWGHKQAVAAYDWLRERLLIYDFLGIADWRDILRTFAYAREKKDVRLFGADSVMRFGIPDDDLAQQGFAAAQFAQFAIGSDSHVVLVNHLNKSDRSAKQRSRGSQQWIDNSHNVLSLHRNEAKAEFIEELVEEKRTGLISEAEFNEKLKSKADKWDSKLDLLNQRWPGSRQNGSRYLFFKRDSLQLFHDSSMESVNWLQTWGAGNGVKE